MNKILLVEDDLDHAELIIDELNTGNIRNEIILMKDGQGLIDFIHESNIDDNVGIELKIDLIISDLNMHKVHGMEVLKFLKDDLRYKSIPVIVISTSSDSSAISEAYENGADGFIAKSASFKEFAMNIRLMKQNWLVQNLKTQIKSKAAFANN